VLCFVGSRGFEFYAEQQILTLKVPSEDGDFNNTKYGSTHVDDFVSKVDDSGNEAQGWSHFRHVRLGCFVVRWDSAPSDAFFERGGLDVSKRDCVTFCDGAQAYYRWPACRCVIEAKEPALDEVHGACPTESWEIFREYDYRSSMSPSTYDISRKLIYQVVTVRIPHVEPSIRHYVRAVSALEDTPKFEFDTRLDRMVFNTAWDFGRSRMVALSFREWGGSLDFSILSFNTSTGALVVRQEHHAVQEQISAVGALLGSGLASADGLGTVDVLFGTYYTVVPAVLKDSPQVVHVIVAIDIETKMVVNSITLPVTLMNLQINALQHTLYGAGADLSGRYAYYELCRAANLSDNITGAERVEVRCNLSELGALPPVVNHMYLQSASMDHQYNYAWFTYKQQATGSPLILEYHHDSADYALWPEDTLPPGSTHTSVIPAAPQLIFSLPSPLVNSARFSVAGDGILVTFTSPTLRGGRPADSDGDGLPDRWDEEKEIGSRSPCERFFDGPSMALISGAMCRWTSDAAVFIELPPEATISPGDLIRVRPDVIYTGARSPGGVYVFSQASTAAAMVQVPEVIPVPEIAIAGTSQADQCAELVLNITASDRLPGSFRWALNGTEPSVPEAHERQLQQILNDLQVGKTSPQVLSIPPNILLSKTKYFFTFTAASFWNENVSATITHSVEIMPADAQCLAIQAALESQPDPIAPAAACNLTAEEADYLTRSPELLHVGRPPEDASSNSSSEADEAGQQLLDNSRSPWQTIPPAIGHL